MIHYRYTTIDTTHDRGPSKRWDMLWELQPSLSWGVVVPIGSVHPRNEPSNEVDLEGRLMEVDESGSGILGNPWEWKKQHEWNMIGF